MIDNRTTEGQKFDDGKPDWSLMDYDLIAPLLPVLELGAKRYGRDNWKKDFGPKYKYRFRAAMRRHDRASQNVPLAINEEDDNCYHLAQLAINALFELYHAIRKENDNDIK